MAAKLVLGLLSPSGAESAINNLIESGFPERSISVVMQNEADARALARDTGPLKGVTASDLEDRLADLGISGDDAREYSRGVADGKAILAVSVSDASQETAAETLRDAGGSQVVTS